MTGADPGREVPLFPHRHMREGASAPSLLAMAGVRPRPWPFRTWEAPVATIDRMADQTPAQSVPLDQQLQEIGAQLAWVRDYL